MFDLNSEVSKVVNTYPIEARETFFLLRELLLKEASLDNTIGEIEETVKWGEPAYLTSSTKSGSTIRIAWKAKNSEHIGIYFNCKTTLVDTYRSIFPMLTFEGSRAIILSINKKIPEGILRECFAMALTYHSKKKSSHRLS